MTPPPTRQARPVTLQDLGARLFDREHFAELLPGVEEHLAYAAWVTMFNPAVIEDVIASLPEWVQRLRAAS